MSQQEEYEIFICTTSDGRRDLAMLEVNWARTTGSCGCGGRLEQAPDEVKAAWHLAGKDGAMVIFLKYEKERENG